MVAGDTRAEEEGGPEREAERAEERGEGREAAMAQEEEAPAGGWGGGFSVEGDGESGERESGLRGTSTCAPHLTW